MINWNKIIKIFGIEFVSKNGVLIPKEKISLKELVQEQRKQREQKAQKQKEARNKLEGLFVEYQDPLLKFSNWVFGRKF